MLTVGSKGRAAQEASLREPARDAGQKGIDGAGRRPRTMKPSVFQCAGPPLEEVSRRPSRVRGERHSSRHAAIRAVWAPPPDARFPGLEDISVLLLPDQSDPLTCHVHGLLSVAGHDEAQIAWQRATCVSARGARSACIGGAGGHGALTMECARSHRLAMSASPAYRDPRSSVEAAESRLNPGVFSECRGTFGGYKYQ